MLRYKTKTRPGLVALYDIRPGNGAGQFLQPQSPHGAIQRITLNASCMTISGERTEQLNIFCRDTGFTTDFLSFIDVELIRFFHGALHMFWRAGCSRLEYVDIRLVY